jgi:multidrug efflux system membrane fusion protein
MEYARAQRSPDPIDEETTMILLRVLSGGFFVLAIGAMTGHAGDKKDDAPFVVPVSKPVQRSVTDFANFTGRTSAKDFVTIQPRVTGYLEKAFKEGAEVKAGDVLFEIDPRPYQAQAAADKAKVAHAEAALKLAKAVNTRFKELAKTPGVVSERELDQYQAHEEQAVAALELQKVNLQTALLNLDWTVVRAPIAGRIGRSKVTVGNLVKQDETKLTTLVSTDSIQVHFELDERTYLRLREAGKDGKVPAKAGADLTVLMGLASEQGYPHRGTVDFVDSRVNPKTGSVMARAILANPKGKDGGSLLLPGMFVRVRLPIGKPYDGLLVVDGAILSEQGLKFVYVVDAENKIESRRVTLGPLQDDGLRVEKGMSLAEVRERVGDNEKDVGSGIHILEYRLDDGSRVLIGFPDLNRLIYVKHEDKAGKVVDLAK